MARHVGFAKIHVFAYSPRKGTAAADMEDAVDKGIIKERSQVLRALGDELGLKYRSRFIGQTAAVLIESGDPKPAGKTERYFTVAISDPPRDLRKNQIVEVRLLESHEDRMTGVLL